MRQCAITQIVLIATLMICASVAIAEVPQVINYQGRLTDSTGVPVDDTYYSIHFQIYDEAAAGNMLWTSFGYVPIPVTGGLFTHMLGSSNPLPDTLSNYDSLWLGITVAPDDEMQPRTLLVSAPYALRSALADMATNSLQAQSATLADTASYATIAETVVRSRDLYHQTLDVNPNSTTKIPFIVRGSSATVSLYVYGSAFQGALGEHTHTGNNAHAHGVSGTVASQSVAHTHSLSSGSATNGGVSHNHTASSASTNVSHGHGGSVGYKDPWHVHSGQTANSTAHRHTLAVDGFPGNGIFLTIAGGGELSSSNTEDRYNTGSVMLAGEHIHGFNTNIANINHNHSLSVSNWTGGSHSHTTTVNGRTSTHSHSLSGSSGSHSISHSHSFSGSATSTGTGIEDSGITGITLPSSVNVYVDGTLAAGPFDGEFSSGELDISSYVTGSGEHTVEIREEGGNGGRITYNLFVE